MLFRRKSKPAPLRFLTALPVYNEVGPVNGVLDGVLKYSPHVAVVDDGSTDGTSELLAKRRDITLLSHSENQGYGAALATAFRYAVEQNYDVLVTIDCDGQHTPVLIPSFVAATANADIVSGSRNLKIFDGDSRPPAERLKINQSVTDEVNHRLGLNLTDAFCGFKAYRRNALQRFDITELGYAMPLEVWVQAACAKLKVVELPVPLIYLDLSRSFGGSLDDGAIRREYYHLTLNRCIAAAESRKGSERCHLPCGEVAE